MLRRFFLGAAVAAAVAAPPALGAWGWLRDTAVSEFTDADWAVFEKTALDALDDAADGEQVDWSNAPDGASGSVKIVETFRHDDHWCRRIAFRHESSRGTRGQGAYNLCLTDGDRWVFVTESEINRRG